MHVQWATFVPEITAVQRSLQCAPKDTTLERNSREKNSSTSEDTLSIPVPSNAPSFLTLEQKETSTTSNHTMIVCSIVQARIRVSLSNSILLHNR